MAIIYQKKLLGISKTSRFAHVGTELSGLEFELILMQYRFLNIPDASWQRFTTSGLLHLVNDRCTSLKKNEHQRASAGSHSQWNFKLF